MELGITDKGYGCFSTEPIPAGDPICVLGSPDFRAIHTEFLHNICDNCYRLDTELDILKKCQGCNAMHYCNLACQKKAWRTHHKLECPVLQRGWVRNHPDAYFRGVLRGLLLHDNGYITRPEFDALLDLCTNVDKFELSIKLNITAMATLIKKLTGTKTKLKEIEKLFYIMWCNAMEIHDIKERVVGVELYTNLSRLNHSCEPNARFMSPRCTTTGRENGGTTIGGMAQYGFLEAIKTIGKDEEVTISYVDSDLPSKERQELLRQWYFECKCPKCQREQEKEAGATQSGGEAEEFSMSSQQRGLFLQMED